MTGPRAFPSGTSVRLTSFQLVIYHRGYVAYRHDRRFGKTTKPRRDFSQLYNVARLSRWKADLSHTRHLFFVGGAGALRAAVSVEEDAAAREGAAPQKAPTTSKTPNPPPPKLRPSAAQTLLDADEVRVVTGFEGPLRGSPLKAAGDAESSWHLRAVKQPEHYDIALRVWRLEGSALIDKAKAIQSSLPGAKEEPSLGKGAFTVKQGKIFGVALAEETHGTLVLLTCGSGQCSDKATLLKLAATIKSRIIRLLPPTKNGGR